MEKENIPIKKMKECKSNCVGIKCKKFYFESHKTFEIYISNLVLVFFHPFFRYEGEWVEGIKQGKGVYTFGSGDVFTGTYENNVRHGEGHLKKIDGEERTENWKEGKLINFVITKEKKGK